VAVGLKSGAGDVTDAQSRAIGAIAGVEDLS
jgi:hypothetical protein